LLNFQIKQYAIIGGLQKYDKAKGNISLKYALEEISRAGELTSTAQLILRLTQ
jgi:hypothetical protein